ncbi:MAG: AbrB/MazE/SpoVT family DNA-binding domain-containing protein [Bacteroidetes bacterium]|nr:AbrB/MazE/SpoVT family DNA-binding domain-containing protein [Bacteroidota bacterium]
MKISATQWGNSLAVRIPKPFADQAGINNGTMVEIVLKNEKIVLYKARESLKDVMQKVTQENLHNEISTGEVKGKEAW